MILGMTTSTFTLVHVLLSFLGIGSGVAVMYGWIAGKRLDGLTAFFLATTVLTSVTGFAFPFEHLTPGLKIGILSMVVLAVAILARYVLHLAGVWRTIYIVSAALALYFNVFVLIAQSFQKVPALKALAPTQQEPPFLVAQLFVLALFVLLTTMATRRFRRA